MAIFLYQIGIFIAIQIASTFGKSSRNTAIVLISTFTILQVFSSGLMILQFLTIFISYRISNNLFFIEKPKEESNKPSFYRERLDNGGIAIHNYDDYIKEKTEKENSKYKSVENISINKKTLLNEINTEYKNQNFHNVIELINFFHSYYSTTFETYSKLIFSLLLTDKIHEAEIEREKSELVLNSKKYNYFFKGMIESYKGNEDISKKFIEKAINNGLTQSELERILEDLECFEDEENDDLPF